MYGVGGVHVLKRRLNGLVQVIVANKEHSRVIGHDNQVEGGIMDAEWNSIVLVNASRGGGGGRLG